MLPTAPLLAATIDIDNATLSQLQQQGVPVIDIRTEAEWRATGVLPNSHLLTLFSSHGSTDPARWLEELRRIAGPQQPLILLCRSGVRTRAAAKLLQRQGYQTVYNAQDGIRSWLADRRPVTAPPAVCKSETRC